MGTGAGATGAGGAGESGAGEGGAGEGAFGVSCEDSAEGGDGIVVFVIAVSSDPTD